MSKYRPSEKDKNDAYEKGWRDAQNDEFDPPTGDGLVDAIFAPIDWLAGSASTKEVAEGLSDSYREGHKSGSRR